jgi:hypothetical protein
MSDDFYGDAWALDGDDWRLAHDRGRDVADDVIAEVETLIEARLRAALPNATPDERATARIGAIRRLDALVGDLEIRSYGGGN